MRSEKVIAVLSQPGSQTTVKPSEKWNLVSYYMHTGCLLKQPFCQAIAHEMDFDIRVLVIGFASRRAWDHHLANKPIVCQYPWLAFTLGLLFLQLWEELHTVAGAMYGNFSTFSPTVERVQFMHGEPQQLIAYGVVYSHYWECWDRA